MPIVSHSCDLLVSPCFRDQLRCGAACRVPSLDWYGGWVGFGLEGGDFFGDEPGEPTVVGLLEVGALPAAAVDVTATTGPAAAAVKGVGGDVGGLVVKRQLFSGIDAPPGQHNDLSFDTDVGIAAVVEPFGIVDCRVAGRAHKEALGDFKWMGQKVREQ